MTLHYDFPCFDNIQKILGKIEGNENFVVVKKEGYTVINYVRSGKETHPEVTDYQTALFRELRGLIFENEWGTLISRPLHKFFNVGERDDIVVDLSKPHYILDKLDGSMIRPLKLNRGPNQDGMCIRWATKMGVTDVSMQAEVFVAKNPKYHDFAHECILSDFTPIFEWCSRQQQIVIDYPEDKLVLLAIRNNFTGEYVSYRELVHTSERWQIPLVKAHDMSHLSLEQLIEHIRALSNEEGVVIRFDDGHMVKIKADEYVSLHRAKSLLDNERDVVGLILDEKTDDLYPLLPDADKQRLKDFDARVWGDILLFQTWVNLNLRITSHMTRKEFALDNSLDNPLIKAACFAHWDTKECPLEYVVGVVRKNLGSRTGFEKIKPILKNARWKETSE